jgi:hypothetical protein
MNILSKQLVWGFFIFLIQNTVNGQTGMDGFMQFYQNFEKYEITIIGDQWESNIYKKTFREVWFDIKSVQLDNSQIVKIMTYKKSLPSLSGPPNYINNSILFIMGKIELNGVLMTKANFIASEIDVTEKGIVKGLHYICNFEVKFNPDGTAKNIEEYEQGKIIIRKKE